MQPGNLVTILPPFNVAYPGTYPVVHVFADGSCAVAVPGWEQHGDTFDPAQGANFAGDYLTATGATVDLATANIAKVPPPPPPDVPVSISMLQLRKCLVLNGLYAQIDSALDAVDHTSDAYLGWQYAATIDRNSPLLLALAMQFGINNLDALWTQAAQIKV